MDFAHSARAIELGDQLQAFIRERVEPVSDTIRAERDAEPTRQSPTMEALQAEARERGLWNLCISDPDLGAGLNNVDYAPLAEIMGPHPLAQEATNCDAPSSVNAVAMAIYASPDQRDRWLEPQLAGQIRSAFAMTEPQVASSDASAMQMTATLDGDSWVLDGRKWWISGVMHPNCEFLVAVANTDAEGGPHARHSQFIVPMDTPGLSIVRNLPKFGYLDPDGHCELLFDQVRIPEDHLLGEIGGGFAIGQARLGPARVQHCMRTIGVVEHALSLMCERAENRSTFGQTVASRANIGDWVAEARIELEAARLLTLRTAWLMDHEGNKAAAPEMSIIKVQVMRMATTVVDRAIQVFGGAGMSEDTPLARIYANMRALRIADGPDEVHLMAIARREFRQQAAARAI